MGGQCLPRQAARQRCLVSPAVALLAPRSASATQTVSYRQNHSSKPIRPAFSDAHSTPRSHWPIASSTGINTHPNIEKRPMKKSLPESLRQAREWDENKRHYLRLGLCHRCAAQISFGHQNGQGFTQIHPPCTDCLPVILTFPTNEVGEWRSSQRRQRIFTPEASLLEAVLA